MLLRGKRLPLIMTRHIVHQYRRAWFSRLALDNILRKARNRGYGENYMGWNWEANIASIAVPL